MPYRLTATLLDSLGVAMCVFDAQDRAVLWNEHFLRFFPEHAPHIHPGEPYADNLRRFYRLRLAPEELGQIERYIQDGIRRHHEQTRDYVFTHRGRKLRVAATPQANGDRVRIWTDLSGLDANLAPEAAPALPGDTRTPEILSVFEHLSDGIAVHDAQGRIVFANDRFVAMYGLGGQQHAMGLDFAALARGCWARPLSPEDADREQDLDAALRDSLNFSGVPFDLPLPGQRWIRVTMSSASGEQTCSCHTDVSRDKRAAAEMHRLTERLRQENHRDVLTGLLNRRGLGTLLQEAAADGHRHSLLYIDLDGFKAVNDAAGHAAGDTVLCRVATLLQGTVRGNDSVVRIGGDEFVVLLRGCDEAQAMAVGGKTVATVGAATFDVRGQPMRIGASVGVRTFNGQGDSPDVLLHDADTACYQAKKQGRGRVVVFGAHAHQATGH